MNLKGTVVFITGASSGIGYACAEEFAKAGSKLLLAARRKDRIDKLSETLKKKYGTKCFAFELDVRNQKEVESAIQSLPESWQSIDILVNNAGLSRGLDKLHEGKIEDWEEMIDTNVKGLLYVTKIVLPGMIARKQGTVINIGSVAGHEVYPEGGVYCASKHAVDAITRSLRMELVDTPIRVCTVDPGLVETEFSAVRFRGDKERASKVYENVEPLTAGDVAEAVLFCATRSAHVQIAGILMYATHQASPTMVHRQPTAK